ncbi:MAG: hypothetical protein M3P45_10400 [Acidobacteriota bacterium]|nr:hypothetical protein [Acidobacteriota bacterium]
MEPNVEPIKEILEELFSLLETLETQSMAITQFLKDQGIATDEKLAPYVDRAGNASSVKWRAARARMQYLLSPIHKEKKEKEPEKEPSEKPPQSEKQQDQKAPPSSTADQSAGAEKSPAKAAKQANGKSAEPAATVDTKASLEKKSAP